MSKYLLILCLPLILYGCNNKTTKYSLSHEAEDYTSTILGNTSNPQQIRIEGHASASNAQGIHIGPDDTNPVYGIGDGLVYDLTFQHEIANARLSVDYSDDVAGNVIAVFVDGLRKSSFISKNTGGWNVFNKSCQQVYLGDLSKGNHTIKFMVETGGSYGVILDRFEISKAKVNITDDRQAAYLFVKGLINLNTGLVQSTECEEFTTVYKNALAAMAFIHEGDFAEAERIFDFFSAHFSADSFSGFTQYWNASTGQMEGQPHYWEGDNAFLLIALEYYGQTRGGYGKYQEMVDGLVAWLADSGNNRDELIIPEGLIDIFAALKPFENELPADTPDVILKLQSAYYKNVAYDTVADHIERSALTLGDLKGFDSVGHFQKADTWRHDGVTVVQGISAFSSEYFINTEISAQLLLGWKIHHKALSVDMSYIAPELEKMWLRSNSNPNARGIPYLTCDQANPSDPLSPVLPVWFDSPVIDSTAYLLFYYWGFNPMAPGKTSFVQNYDFLECENYSSQTGLGNIETHSDAVAEQTLQIGNDANEVSYELNLQRSYNNAAFHIRYSDDVAGNIVQVYVDNVLKGAFTTVKTAGWNDFTWNDEVSLNTLSSGTHILKLVSSGGTYGANLDVIKIVDQ